jgi:hypothetical protein
MPLLDVHHRPGNHCASTGIRDMVNYHGLDWSEAMCFGIGAGLGIWYLDLPGQSPSRMVHVRSADIESQFFQRIGIPFEWQHYQDPAESERALISVIDQGTPAIIQTDIFHLPYYNSSTHFPGHVITVWGYNLDKSVFIVTDTEREELLEVSFTALRKARYSNNGFFQCAGNLFAPKTITEPDDLETVLRESIRYNSKTLLDGVETWGGVAVLNKWRNELIDWPRFKDSQWAVRFAYQTIEKRGTGGGGFRQLYARFLKEAAVHLPEITASGLPEKMTLTAEAWQTLASALKTASEEEQPDYTAVDQGINAVLSIESDYHRTAVATLDK